ncbi:FAD-dependent monooxygenase [Streptomyces sp. LHD-70]|uniref:FAD-dependent monooxygenase n=1 Tax=Streptomyces sp. LHD-70 TaxID=3072140 RepID=UPI00280EC6F7|nr:FAD-dependent monooxygenase [Streptomyces sp. LHD-70]MDQ8706917.1 FAD-dependent monooxygenase [Streptomyces sp. LHD-70]
MADATRPDTPVDTEVAVVGGGPVGMLLARELALLGVRTTVLERLPAPTGESKAGTLHARSGQTLNRRGLLEAVQPGRPAPRTVGGPVPFHFAGMFDLDLAAVVDEGPVIIGSPQAWAQEVFGDDAVRLGATVRRDSEVTGLDEEPGRVRLTVRSGDGDTRTLTARWVVGADGARSAVRRLTGIPFTGTPAGVGALIGEVRLLDPGSAPRGWQRNSRGWTLVWLNPFGHSRVCTYDFRGPHADRQAPVGLDEFRAEVERIAGRSVPMDSPSWLTRFSDAALQAERYREGRVLLAGDAAHVHFPAGGQGVNLGLQDAVNLGWKLAAEVRGHAPEGLLDTYQAERHPVAAAVLDNVRAQVALMDPSPRMDALRELFAELMHMDEVNAKLSSMISGTDVAYDLGADSGALAGRFAPDLPLKSGTGQRSLAELLHSARPLLLLLAENPGLAQAARPWADRVDVVTATAVLHPGADALLVRPDGYVAWSARGTDADGTALRRALTRWFGAPAAE